MTGKGLIDEVNAEMKRVTPQGEQPPVLSVEMRQKLSEFVSRERAKLRGAALPSDAHNTFGGINQLLTALKNAPSMPGFNSHTPYVLGDFSCDSAAEKVVAAVSTEELLLNAFRQDRCSMGGRAYIMVDTTHRLVTHGHCMMPIGTMTPSQNFRIIAYGICDTEDEAAHTQVIKQVYEAVHHVVQARALSKTPVV